MHPSKGKGMTKNQYARFHFVDKSQADENKAISRGAREANGMKRNEMKFINKFP